MSKNIEDEGDWIKFDEIPTPEVDMKYRFITVPILKYFTAMVRASFEYAAIIQHMKNFMDFDKCAYYDGYSIQNGFTIELHHSPFTLFDICEAVSNKHLKEQEYVRTMEVCEEVTKLHFQFKVGLVPLNPTAHKLFHSGSMEIHPNLIKGYWREFYEEYKDFLSDEAKDKHTRMEDILKDESIIKVPPILERKPIKIDIKNQIKLSQVDLTQILIDSPTKRLEQIE